MKDKNPSGVTYIEQLTWLRGIAAFLVIISHSLQATSVKYTETDEVSPIPFFLRWLNLGSFGVTLFLVLSGCTLYISNSNKISRHSILNFYIKRCFRIWPAFAVSMTVYIGFGFIFSTFYLQSQGHWIEKQFLASYTVADIVNYLSLTFNISGPSGLFNNAYWSLPVEFQYYLIFPVIIILMRYVGLFGPILIGSSLFLMPKLGLFIMDDESIFTLSLSFCGGVIVGYIYQNFSFHINTLLGLCLLLALFTLASSITNSYITLPDIPFISGIWNWYIAIAIASVFIALFTKVNIHNKIELFLKHYGTISYSTYLYHNIFVAIAVLIIIQLEISNGNLRLFLTLLYAIIGSYIAASISYKYIEEPFITIGRNILAKNNDKNKHRLMIRVNIGHKRNE